MDKMNMDMNRTLNPVEVLLAKSVDGILTNYENRLYALRKKHNGNEEAINKEIESFAENIREEDQVEMANATQELVDKCKWDDVKETFNGYDSNGQVFPECQTAVTRYVAALRTLMEF